MKKLFRASVASGFLLSLILLIALTGCQSSRAPADAAAPPVRHAAAPVASGPPVPTAADIRAACDKAWQLADRTATEEAYEGFAKAHPDDPRAAKAKANAVRQAWRHAQNAGTTDAYQAFVDQYPDDSHSGDGRTLAQGIDISLTDALHRGWVTSHVTGDNLQSVSLTVERKINRPLRVSVPAGTYFVSGGDAQNMVAREDNTADLTSTTSCDISVNASCANFYLAQPDSDNNFSVQKAHPNAQLRRLLAVIAKQSPSSIASQLAIWSITDDPSQDDVSGHISPAPESDDYRQAAQLLRDAGIKPSSKQMFH